MPASVFVWHDHAMRVRGLLLALFAVFAVVHVLGVLFASPLLPAAPVLAWGCLLGYAVLAGAGARWAVRWPLLAAVVVIGAATVVDWLAYSNPSAAGQTYQVFVAAPADFDLWDAELKRVAPFLLASGLLAAAVLTGSAGRRPPPGRARTVIGVGTLIALGLAAGFTALQLWALPGSLTQYGWDLAAGVAVAFAVAVVAILAARAAAACAGTARLAAAGLCLLAFTALWVLADLVAAVPRPFSYSIREPGLHVELYAVMVTINPLDTGWSTTTAALAAAQLVAVAAVTAGWLRASAAR